METEVLQKSVKVSVADPSLSPDILVYIQKLESLVENQNAEIKNLSGQLAAEGANNAKIEKKLKEKKKKITQENHTYNPLKSDGVPKARPAESIRSYSDFKSIQDYFLKKGRIRDWAMWTIGVCLGVRVSDLLSLKFYNLFEYNSRTFRKRIQIYEIKTGKLNNLLITEAVIDAMTKYCEHIKWDFFPDQYVFFSEKTGEKMYEESGWRILSRAGKDLNLPINIGSHTMRKSFANIAACVDKAVVDMNSLTKIQGLLNHSNQSLTMRYLGTYQDMYDKARIAVSDFVLGKTDIDELVIGSGYTLDDIINKIEELEQKLGQEK